MFGALAWLSRGTRPDLAGRVALVQQCFPNPTLEDAINTNKIVDDAHAFKKVELVIQPNPVVELVIQPNPVENFAIIRANKSGHNLKSAFLP